MTNQIAGDAQPLRGLIPILAATARGVRRAPVPAAPYGFGEQASQRTDQPRTREP